jgi:hypothetical protein
VNSASQLLERWRELQNHWTDDVSIKFGQDFLEQIITNCQQIDALMERVEEETRNRPVSSTF